MALTLNKTAEWVAGDRRMKVFDVTFDASYPTGGEPVSLADLGFSGEVSFLLAEPTGGYSFEYNPAAGTLLAYRTGAINAPGEQVPNTTNLATINTRVFAIGR